MRTAVVTGGNKGIGFELCRQLAARDVRVVLAARDEARGRAAAARLPGVEVRQLDVTDEASVARFAAELDAVDILINNAGVALDKWRSALDLDLATLRATLETNVIGAFAVTRALAPLLRASGRGRIVNVSSALGSLHGMTGMTLAYRMSKTALNALTRVLADELRADGVLVNSACPGWVRTELGGPDAPRAVQDATDTVLWLATLPDDGPTGGFYRDRAVVPW